MAALREIPQSARQLLRSPAIRKPSSAAILRCASTDATTPAASSNSAPLPVVPDVEMDSGLMTPIVDRKDASILDPRKRAARRYRETSELPHGRYRYHAPKYYRGPLHPVQPLPTTDPAARDFSPGPFNLPRLKHTYHSTLASDILTLTYQHILPGTPDRPERIRLREWEGDSPYMENRPKRGPRGNDVLFPLENNITFRNVPEIRAIHLAMFMPHAKKTSDQFIVAKSILQNISGVRPTKTYTRRSVSEWGIIKGDPSGFKCSMYGEQAWEFLDKVINLVFPKIKEWPGVKGTTGDSSGNLSFGFTPAELMYFPELEANYSLYPAKMIPGCRVFVQTSAKSDRHARLLLQSMGVPFYGKIVD